MVTHIKPEEKSWVIDVTPEMAHAANVAEGSLVVLSFKDGDVMADILPAQGEDLEKKVRQVVAEFGEAFAEMKRRGD